VSPLVSGKSQNVIARGLCYLLQIVESFSWIVVFKRIFQHFGSALIINKYILP